MGVPNAWLKGSGGSSYIPLAIKRAVFKRDGYQCQLCGSTVQKLGFVHLWPKCRGGKDKFNNLVVACEVCKKRKQKFFPLEFFVFEDPEDLHLKLTLTVKVVITKLERGFLVRKGAKQVACSGVRGVVHELKKVFNNLETNGQVEVSEKLVPGQSRRKDEKNFS